MRSLRQILCVTLLMLLPLSTIAGFCSPVNPSDCDMLLVEIVNNSKHKCTSFHVDVSGNVDNLDRAKKIERGRPLCLFIKARKGQSNIEFFGMYECGPVKAIVHAVMPSCQANSKIWSRYGTLPMDSALKIDQDRIDPHKGILEKLKGGYIQWTIDVKK